MATRWGLFTTNGDWANTANWSLTDGGATGATIPIDGDTVFIKPYGTYQITTSLNQSAIQLAALSIVEAPGNVATGFYIGTEAAALQIDATTLYISTTRASYIKLSGAFPSLNIAQLGNGRYIQSGGSVATRALLGSTGHFTFEQDVAVGALETAGMGGVLKADAANTDMDLTVGRGASVEVWRRIRGASIGGRLTTAYGAAGAATAGSSRWFVDYLGVLDMRHTGNVAAITAKPGSRVIGTNASSLAAAPTISELLEHVGSDVNIPASLYAVTYAPVGIPAGSPGPA